MPPQITTKWYKSCNSDDILFVWHQQMSGVQKKRRKNKQKPEKTSQHHWQEPEKTRRNKHELFVHKTKQAVYKNTKKDKISW